MGIEKIDNHIGLLTASQVGNKKGIRLVEGEKGTLGKLVSLVLIVFSSKNEVDNTPRPPRRIYSTNPWDSKAAERKGIVGYGIGPRIKAYKEKLMEKGEIEIQQPLESEEGKSEIYAKKVISGMLEMEASEKPNLLKGFQQWKFEQGITNRETLETWISEQDDLESTLPTFIKVKEESVSFQNTPLKQYLSKEGIVSFQNTPWGHYQTNDGLKLDSLSKLQEGASFSSNMAAKKTDTKRGFQNPALEKENKKEFGKYLSHKPSEMPFRNMVEDAFYSETWFFGSNASLNPQKERSSRIDRLAKDIHQILNSENNNMKDIRDQTEIFLKDYLKSFFKELNGKVNGEDFESSLSDFSLLNAYLLTEGLQNFIRTQDKVSQIELASFLKKNIFSPLGEEAKEYGVQTDVIESTRVSPFETVEKTRKISPYKLVVEEYENSAQLHENAGSSQTYASIDPNNLSCAHNAEIIPDLSTTKDVDGLKFFVQQGRNNIVHQGYVNNLILEENIADPVNIAKQQLLYIDIPGRKKDKKEDVVIEESMISAAVTEANRFLKDTNKIPYDHYAVIVLESPDEFHPTSWARVTLCNANGIEVPFNSAFNLPNDVSDYLDESEKTSMELSDFHDRSMAQGFVENLIKNHKNEEYRGNVGIIKILENDSRDKTKKALMLCYTEEMKTNTPRMGVKKPYEPFSGKHLTQIDTEINTELSVESAGPLGKAVQKIWKFSTTVTKNLFQFAFPKDYLVLSWAKMLQYNLYKAMRDGKQYGVGRNETGLKNNIVRLTSEKEAISKALGELKAQEEAVKKSIVEISEKLISLPASIVACERTDDDVRQYLNYQEAKAWKDLGADKQERIVKWYNRKSDDEKVKLFDLVLSEENDAQSLIAKEEETEGFKNLQLASFKVETENLPKVVEYKKLQESLIAAKGELPEKKVAFENLSNEIAKMQGLEWKNDLMLKQSNSHMDFVGGQIEAFRLFANQGEAVDKGSQAYYRPSSVSSVETANS